MNNNFNSYEYGVYMQAAAHHDIKLSYKWDGMKLKELKTNHF